MNNQVLLSAWRRAGYWQARVPLIRTGHKKAHLELRRLLLRSLWCLLRYCIFFFPQKRFIKLSSRISRLPKGKS